MRHALFGCAAVAALVAVPAAAQSSAPTAPNEPPWLHIVDGARIEGLTSGAEVSAQTIQLRVRTGDTPIHLRVIRAEMKLPSNEWRPVHWGLPADAPAQPLDFDVGVQADRVLMIPHDSLSVPSLSSRREYRVLLEVGGQLAWIRAASLMPSEVVSGCW